MLRVVHISSAHPRDDTRIFRKQCASLASNGYDIHLVIADGGGDENIKSVHIHGVKKAKNKLNRIVFTSFSVIVKAIKLRADIYHLHDPELAPYGVILRAITSAKVVFDSHEDFPAQLLSKNYLGPVSKKALSRLTALMQRIIFPCFHAIVAATPHIQKQISKCHKQVALVQNFPETISQTKRNCDLSKQHETQSYICYIGALSEIRGIEHLIDAMSFVKTNTKLLIAGTFNDKIFEERIRHKDAWEFVEFHSQIPFSEVQKLLEKSSVGMVTFLNHENHVRSQPNKLFEYMGAGLPVIASNFPIWQDMVNKIECGICVPPDDAKAIASAIDHLITSKAKAIEMGRNGQEAVKNKLNWGREYNRLDSLYKSLMENM